MPWTEPRRHTTLIWMTDMSMAENYRRYHSFVPMVADVWQLMNREGINQDEAVRRLGGTP